MKKIVSALLIILVVSSLCAGAGAEDSSRHYDFILTCDGESEVSKEQEENFTVTLSLECTNLDKDTKVSAFQTEICYDDEVLRFNPDSLKLSEGVHAVDIRTEPFGRRIRVSYVIPEENALFEKNTELMSFDFTVLYEFGRTDVIQENYLVSTEDGNDIYSCDAEDLAVNTESQYIPSYSVAFEAMNGETFDTILISEGTVVDEPETVPTREGYTFGGWYSDTGYEHLYDFTQPVNTNLTLYAKWDKAEEPTKPWIIYAIAVPLAVGLAAFLILKRKKKE